MHINKHQISSYNIVIYFKWKTIFWLNVYHNETRYHRYYSRGLLTCVSYDFIAFRCYKFVSLTGVWENNKPAISWPWTWRTSQMWKKRGLFFFNYVMTNMFSLPFSRKYIQMYVVGCWHNMSTTWTSSSKW